MAQSNGSDRPRWCTYAVSQPDRRQSWQFAPSGLAKEGHPRLSSIATVWTHSPACPLRTVHSRSPSESTLFSPWPCSTIAASLPASSLRRQMPILPEIQAHSRASSHQPSRLSSSWLLLPQFVLDDQLVRWAQVMRVTMVMNQCAGVVALFVVALTAPFLLRTVAGESSVASAELDLYEDVPMIDLNEELERFYNWSRPRERRLDSTLLWCISKSNVSQAALQSSLDWVCGTNPNQGQVNCGPVNVGGACYDPNTLSHHCDWAFNSYFQRMNATSSACDFQGAAQEVTTDPSTSTCLFQGSNLTVITNGTVSPSPPANSPGTAPGPTNIYGSGATGALEPQFLFRVSTALTLFTYLFT